MDIKSLIRDIPDFPKKGIVFKDITPLLKDARAFEQLIHELFINYKTQKIDVIAGIESRGFIIGSALALLLGKGFVPIRKKGKLPYDVVEETYEKEYGFDTLEVHTDSIKKVSSEDARSFSESMIQKKDQSVLIVDDLLATGGTALAAAKLVEKLSGSPKFCFAIELEFLKGREKLKDYEVFSLIKY